MCERDVRDDPVRHGDDTETKEELDHGQYTHYPTFPPLTDGDKSNGRKPVTSTACHNFRAKENATRR
jgi:hypothetical protein